MLERHAIRIGLLLMAELLFARHAVGGAIPVEVLVPLADRLVEEQVSVGDLKGTWPGDEAYTGAIVAGLARACEVTGDDRYRQACEAGAEFFIGVAQGNLYGDEAYALMVLSEMAGEQKDDKWFPILRTFYADVKDLFPGSTSAYLSEFDEVERSVAVFDLAHHTVSAYYVDAEDKHLWKQAMIDSLKKVDDSSAMFPVMALGVATWAAAATGGLDDSMIDPLGEGTAYWRSKRLSDLPGLLMDHQVGEEGVLPGSFYWRFDHSNGASDGPDSGFTEDLVFASLALSAASRADLDDWQLQAVTEVAREALLSSLRGVDTVHEHLWLLGGDDRLYTGEALRAVAQFVGVGDLDLGGESSASWISPRRTGTGVEEDICVTFGATGLTSAGTNRRTTTIPRPLSGTVDGIGIEGEQNRVVCCCIAPVVSGSK